MDLLNRALDRKSMNGKKALRECLRGLSVASAAITGQIHTYPKNYHVGEWYHDLGRLSTFSRLLEAGTISHHCLEEIRGILEKYEPVVYSKITGGQMNLFRKVGKS